MPGRFKNALLDFTLHIELWTHMCDTSHRHMRKVLVPVTHQHICTASHAGVDGMLSKHQAALGIQRIGRETADRVTGVNILNRYFFMSRGKIVRDLVPEEPPDVLETWIA